MEDKILDPAADMHSSHDEPNPHAGEYEDAISLGDLMRPMRQRWKTLVGASLVAGAAAGAFTYLLTPEFTSTTTFLPPQQQQSAAAGALASLGALAGLAGAPVKSPADQFVSLMQSVTVSDRMIDRYQLMTVYHKKYRRDARAALQAHVMMALGKKDGLISVAVDDESPQRAADMANQYVEELRRMTSVLAVSEAQQRRVFFEKQMQETKEKLIVAQVALQGTGFGAGALKAEPQAAADQYARLKAQATAAEVRLQTLRTSLAETSRDVQQQATLLEALRSQLAQLEAATEKDGAGPDYISKYREFKYQETLFELLSKQYELARVDEAHEGALIQVVDRALPAELKSKPRRTVFALVGAFLGLLLSAAWVLVRDRRLRVA